jgi:hypothetical protein
MFPVKRKSYCIPLEASPERERPEKSLTLYPVGQVWRVHRVIIPTRG